MCGIAGIININQDSVSSSDLINMSKVMGHRGPDDEGFVLINTKSNQHRAYSGGGSCTELHQRYSPLNSEVALKSADIALAHRRFSIIDLSSKGHQPFLSSDKSTCVVFNGEIYNYVELREELQSQGIIFHTNSDTEVLIESYLYWGTECFNKFNGFWALAIYDFKKKQLIISRDRVGKKPLFYTRYGNTIAFASEIKSLLQISDINEHKKVNERALYEWLMYGRKNLHNESLYDGIMMLPAGSWTIVNSSFPNNINKFWQLGTQRLKESDISVKEASEQVLCLLKDAVKIRLRADVPACVELSGGMDSSALVALAAMQRPEQITSFTVRFEEKQHNEEPYARMVAERFNTNYHVMNEPADNFWSHVLAFTYLEEEPYHSPNLQTNQEIWQKMRSLGMKISLNGAAGDELFAGYPFHMNPALLENLQQGQISTFLNNLFKDTESGSLFHTSSSFMRFSAVKALYSCVKWRKNKDVNSAYIFNERYNVADQSIRLSSILNSAMTHSPMPYWLCSGDRGYMGIPIEVRAPFLDYRLIEYAYQLPTTYLIRDGWHKWIFRKAMDGILPPEVNWRKNKMGFPFPLEQFLTENKDIVEYIFSHSSNPYINYSKKETLYSNWRAISFVLWYELFFNENITLFKDIESMSGKQTIVRGGGEFNPSFYDSCYEVFQ